MFLVVSQSDFHLGFDHPFLRTRSGAQVKLRARKVGRLERNLSTPVLYLFFHAAAILRII